MFLSGPRGAAARTPVRLSAAMAAWLFVLATPAAAQQPYFAGQTIELLSGYSEGNEGNIVLQAWARAFERLYPGTRVIVRVNSGGTSALAAELLAAAAPDGLTIGTTDTDTLIARAIGEETHDISQFAILGAMTRRENALWASAATPVTSLDDLYAAPAIQPVRATTSNSRFTGLFLNAFLGTRIQAVTGYSSSEAELAFINGEGALFIEAVEVGRDKWLDNGTGAPLLLITKYGDVPEPFSAIPYLAELDGDPDFGWVPGLLQGLAYGRLLAAPLDTPPDRVEALREAFMRIAADETFSNEANVVIELDPSRGDEIEAIVANLLETFGELGPLIATALDCGEWRITNDGECAM